jgi:hypothetical protein
VKTICVKAPETWLKYCVPIKATVAREFIATSSAVEQNTALPNQTAALSIPINRRNPVTLQP